MNFKTSHNVLRKQGWIFRDLHKFHIIIACKKKSKKKCSQNQVDFIYILVRYEQNQSCNIQGGIERCFSKN